MLGGIAGQGPGAAGGSTLEYFSTPIYNAYYPHIRIHTDYFDSNSYGSKWIKSRFTFSSVFSPSNDFDSYAYPNGKLVDFFVGLSGGQLWAAGVNGYGQLGQGTTANADPNIGSISVFLPVRIGNSSNWTTACAGPMGSVHGICGGQLWAWGANALGQLGDGSTTVRTSPVRIGNSSNWTVLPKKASVANCAGICGGQLWAWGYNGYNEVGDGTATQRTSPVRIGNSSNWTDIACGSNHTLGVCGGQLWAWGKNNVGQLGDGTTTQRSSPVRIENSSNWTRVWAWQYSSFGLCGGVLYSWGNNVTGVLGLGITSASTNTPKLVSGANGITDLNTGANGSWASSYGITSGNLLWWSRVSGTTASPYVSGTPSDIVNNTPQVSSYDGNWLSVSGDGEVKYATKSDGFMWFMPYTALSYPFIGTTNGFKDWVETTADYSGILYGGITGATAYKPNNNIQFDTISQYSGIKNGELYTWGSKLDYYKLSSDYDVTGHGFTAYHVFFPLRVGTSKNWTHTQSTFYRGAGICGGQLWTWGGGSPVQSIAGLGNGTSAGSIGPYRVGNSSNWTDIVCNQYAIIGICGGQLWGWGYNVGGLCGVTLYTAIYSPKRLDTGNTWKRVFASPLAGTVFGISGDDSLWSWGSDASNALGGRGSINQLTTTPTKITLINLGSHGITGWKYVSCDGGCAFGVKTEQGIDRVYGWGSNGSSQLLQRDYSANFQRDQAFVRFPVEIPRLKGLTGIQSITFNRDYYSYYQYYYYYYNETYYKFDPQLSAPLGISGGGQLWGWGGISFGPNFDTNTPPNYTTGAYSNTIYPYEHTGTNWKSILPITYPIVGLKGFTT